MTASGSAAFALTTHVLDTSSGLPAAGLRVELWRLGGPDGADRRLLREAVTNADGRCDGPLLAAGDFEPGVYELLFHAGGYFRSRGAALPEPAFLDRVPVRFGVAEARHHHVPLLISPYGYSTYRGS